AERGRIRRSNSQVNLPRSRKIERHATTFHSLPLASTTSHRLPPYRRPFARWLKVAGLGSDRRQQRKQRPKIEVGFTRIWSGLVGRENGHTFGAIWCNSGARNNSFLRVSSIWLGLTRIVPKERLVECKHEGASGRRPPPYPQGVK